MLGLAAVQCHRPVPGSGQNIAGAVRPRGEKCLVQLFGPTDAVAVDAYFVYAEELKSLARIKVFRDFLLSKAQRWHY